jgi:hypothetical protein
LYHAAPCSSDLVGSAEWAANYSNENMNLDLQQSASSQGWSFVHKVLLFGVIIGAVAFYTQRSKTAGDRSSRDNKSMA